MLRLLAFRFKALGIARKSLQAAELETWFY